MKFWILPFILLLASLGVRAEKMLDCGDYKTDDYISLACNIYWEGRNQDTEGMIAIASVTLWRVLDPDYPNTIAGVVWDKRISRKTKRYVAQFSWTLDGKKDFPLRSEQKQWDQSLKIARLFTVDAKYKALICPQIAATNKMWDILEAQKAHVTRRPVRCEAYETILRSKYSVLALVDKTDGSIMYHAEYVSPAWKHKYIKVVQLGKHIFYRKDDQPS